MRRASARSPRGRLWRVLYSVCLAFVVSFVLFEVLDIDGSDFRFFTTPTGRAMTSQTEEHKADLRRACILAVQLTSLAAAPPKVGFMTSCLGRVSPVLPLVVVLGHHHRIALPRASLNEAAPSA